MGSNKVVPINEEVMEKQVMLNDDEEMSLDKMVEMKKMLDRRIRDIMKNKLTCERVFVNHRKKTAKRGESWRIRFKNMVNGDPSSQERMVTLYATTNKGDLIKGIDDILRMLNGLKEELEKEQGKEVPQEKETKKEPEPVKDEKKEEKPVSKPEQKKDKGTSKQNVKGGTKK